MLCTLSLTLLSLRFSLALDGIVAPALVSAGEPFEVSFENGGSDPRDQYRVFLAAASVGQNGPMCYLQNLTSLTSPFSAIVPACVGPDADDYSIGIADITTGQGATFGNKFNLTGGNETRSPYEEHLGGAPFWDAYNLPCSAMSCARKCAQTEFPADLSDDTAYRTMSDCIETCPGVTPSRGSSNPVAAHPADDVPVAVVTLASDVVITAWQTVISADQSTLTEAVVGTRTFTLGSAIETLSSATISLASDGLVVGGSSTVPFTTTTRSSSSTDLSPAETIGLGGDAVQARDRWSAAAAVLAIGAAVLA